MKQATLLILLFMLIVYSFQACKKVPGDKKGTTTETLIESARLFFDASLQHVTSPASGNYRTDAGKNINWRNATVVQLSSGPAVVLPVQYIKDLSVTTNFGGPKLLNLNEVTHLVIFKDNESVYHAELVTTFPDSNFVKSHSQKFTGIVFVESWSGQRLRQLKFNADGIILEYSTSAEAKMKTASVPVSPHSQMAPTTFIVDCDEIDGYNYSASDPEDGFAWSENAGCSVFYFDASGGIGDIGAPTDSDYGSLGGGGQNSPTPPTPEITLSHGPNIIADIQDYFKCFTNVGGTDHTYNVTICVDQPIPGTRQAWNFQDGPSGSSAANNIFDVGHVFLIFSETYGGNTITRNVGFYPKTVVNPLYPSDQGQLNDNESSAYNISLTVSIDNAQFFNMLNYVSHGNNPGYQYNLNSNNCTTFALTALQNGSVALFSQVGSWAGGFGYDPGDLGEDIRSMVLQPNMSVSTVETSHSNFGNCN